MNINQNKHYISFNKLDEYNIINLYTTKPFNFRFNQVSIDDIKNQYDEIEKILNKHFNKIIKPNQNHTNNVICVTKENIDYTFDNVDGLITNIPNIALVTSLADCQGIILLDRSKNVIGNIHSGWKGTLNKIIKNAINLMIDNYSCKLDDIEIFISPSILKCCFEVDEDVKDLFVSSFDEIDINSCISLGEIKDNKQKYFIDTTKINELECIYLGIKKEHIFISNICSKCNSDVLHSHRAQSDNSGRNILLVSL